MKEPLSGSSSETGKTQSWKLIWLQSGGPVFDHSASPPFLPRVDRIISSLGVFQCCWSHTSHIYVLHMQDVCSLSTQYVYPDFPRCDVKSVYCSHCPLLLSTVCPLGAVLQLGNQNLIKTNKIFFSSFFFLLLSVHLHVIFFSFSYFFFFPPPSSFSFPPTVFFLSSSLFSSSSSSQVMLSSDCSPFPPLSLSLFFLLLHLFFFCFLLLPRFSISPR